MFVGKGGENCKLTGVYFILRLKANLVSLGQLDEVGCFISIKRGLTDVYFIPSLKANLVSLGQLDKVGCFISIERRLLKICDDR